MVVALVASTVVTTGAGHAGAAGSAFAVQPSVNQVAVTGAPRGATARLTDRAGRQVASRSVDTQGSVLFRTVPAGAGYVVTVAGRSSRPVRVLGPNDTPPESFYRSQQLGPGFGYLKTRDGTLLSMDVHLPGPIDAGPYPTVVEYSGYDPSNPDDTQPASAAAQAVGFATVGVNLRGTGCSGGSWDYFEPLQSLDGYDAIETIAAQPWVANGKVGMVGISYPGITQLFVARTRPPHLAAITPLSVLDDTAATIYPGGIFNDGFALQWAQERQQDAKPSGPAWVKARIAHGDTTCARNQALRLQSPDALARIRAHAFTDASSASLAPATFVHDIDVPVFIAGSWQDQETGSHFADMLGDFAPGVPVKVTLENGVHADSLNPTILSRWVEFLDFYVARRIPSISPAQRAFATLALSSVFGPGVTLEPDRFTGAPSYAAALAQYEAEPPVRVLFDMGAGGAPGAAIPGFSITAPSWPLPGTQATTYWLGPRGTLSTAPPAAAGSGPEPADRYSDDASAFPRTDGKVSNGYLPTYDWKPVPAGKALAYVSAPLAHDTVLAGTGSVDLWLKSTAPDVDLQVVLTEVRPDGRETYVQSGWLRASQRKLDTRTSTPLLPVQTHTRRDAAPLPRGRASLVEVPLYPFAHAFRAGSRIRIVVQPPGGNSPAWAFGTLHHASPPVDVVDRSSAHPSKVVLPVATGVAVPTPLPPCGALRGQPCRTYVPLVNRSAST